MIEPDSIKLLQDFSFAISQGLIASIIVEWKKSKDEYASNKKVNLLQQYEYSKPIEERIGRTICEAIRNLELKDSTLQALLPLASDPVFNAELAKQVVADKYSAEAIAKIIIDASHSLGSEIENLKKISELFVGAIQSAIADDPHLHRTKELQFQVLISEKIDDVKVETIKSQNVYTNSLEGIDKKLQEILKSTQLFSDKTDEPLAKEKIYHDRIDQARKLLATGKARSALGMLTQLRVEIACQNNSKELLFRIATNIASCAIQIDDQKTAVKEILLASEIDPENIKAITNLATAELIAGRPEEALKLATTARTMSPSDPVATANYIQSLFALNRDAELDALLSSNAWIENDPDCSFSLGTLYHNKGDYQKAESFLRKGLSANQQDSRIQLNLALSLVRPVQNALLGQPVLVWKFPPEYRTILEEALSLATEAIKAQKDFEHRERLSFAYMLRSDIRRMLGDIVGALADCEKAIHEDPSNYSAFSIKALAHMRAGEPHDAVKAFESIQNPSENQTVLIPMATAYNAAARPDKVIALLIPLWDESSADLFQIKIADQLLWSYGQMKNAGAAEKVIKRLKSTWPTNSEALHAIASYLANFGDINVAADILTEALTCASGLQRHAISLELAEIFAQKGEFSKAVEYYETAADLTTDNLWARNYLVCLYNSGMHKQAFQLAKRLRGEGPPLPLVSQIEANISAEIGDLAAAQDIMEQLSKMSPFLAVYKVCAAEFAMRRGLQTKARTLLNDVQYLEIKLDANLLLRVAQLRAVLEMGDVLSYLYQARRIGFSSAVMHGAYVWLFLSHQQREAASFLKETIDVECSVLLESNGGRLQYTILSESVLFAERGEISVQNAQELNLIGLKKGDKFVINKDAFGNDIETTVIEIQSKYTRAFQETLEKFPALFPTDKTLQGIHGPYEKLRDGVIHQLDERQNWFRQASSFYEAKQATFEILAKIIHCSPIELWGMLTSGRYCAFANFSGDPADAKAQSENASNATSTLLDITAVLAFAQLGLLEKLTDRYELFITQPTMDAIIEAHAKVSLSNPGVSIGKVGEQYIRQETTIEQITAQKIFLESIVKFLSTKAKIIPVPDVLEKADKHKDFYEIIGPISTTAIFAAIANRTLILHSEDQMLRALVLNEWQIKSVSAQPILFELLSKKIISREVYVEAIARLFFMNFTVVPISAENFLWAITKVHYEITDDIRKMLTIFHGPNCNFESAIFVLSEATKQFWLEMFLFSKKIDILDAILDALGTNRPTKQVAKYFTVAMNMRLFLVPNAAKTIEERIRSWEERKLGRSGIIIPDRYRR